VRTVHAGFAARRNIVAAMVIALLALLFGSQWDIAATRVLPVHHDGPVVVAGPSGHLSASAVHAHIQAADHAVPDGVGDITGTRGRMVLAMLGVVLLAGVSGCCDWWLRGRLGRAPPRFWAGVVAGRVLLIRLCISRR